MHPGLRDNLKDKFVLIIQDLVRTPTRTAQATTNLFNSGLQPGLGLQTVPDPATGYPMADLQRFEFQQMRDFYENVAWVYMGIDESGEIVGLRGALTDEELAQDALLQQQNTRLYFGIVGIDNQETSPTTCLNPQWVQGASLYDVPNTFPECQDQSWTRHDCILDSDNFACLPNTAEPRPGYNVHNRCVYSHVFDII